MLIVGNEPLGSAVSIDPLAMLLVAGGLTLVDDRLTLVDEGLRVNVDRLLVA